ncbi:putative receptor-like protein kinase At3g47110 [Ziziphus jujuba]|uniref:Receptor-like protein kinase At3g47110 n=1 Tax=Ziziphus jujuba TaxID=326968 RepID=A0A6P3ZV54_ZIZJJ|nr:putative receptor-like protein kinase At3g47110 [Ziziphus jujuba]
MTWLFLVLGGNNETDRMSLLVFKAQIIDDPLGILSSWNGSLHFCEWAGITCSPKHQRVTKLDLQSFKLKGHLSPHIGNLSFLRELHLENNSIFNYIPPEIGRLSRLQILHLQNNSLSGEIPVNISRCSSLQDLSLGHNKLTGKLPEDLSLLSKLEVLYLSSNSLIGKIPSSYGNLSSLEVLSAGHNYFLGSIPDSFGQLKSLAHLGLGSCNLSGTLPPSIYNLSSITNFYVHMNNLHGTLPPNMGHTLPNLENLLFHTNQFNGQIPVSISNASKLTYFEISLNNFVGKVPSFADLSNLYFLGIQGNNLGYGEAGDLEFVSSLVNCTSLEMLEINHNNFGGAFPESVSNLSTNMWVIMFDENQISGSIPSGIGNLINLEQLVLGTNQLTGLIPSSIGKLQKLKELLLHANKLSGTIPSSLGNLTSLILLSLSSNNLHGSIPSSLGRCRDLVAMNLSSNNLSGSIPKEVIGLSSLSLILDLSTNNLTGSIHGDVGKLVNLGHLNISENKLSGEIPQELGSCTILVYLYLQGNSLQGNIPQTLSSLRGIAEINLAGNNLSGEVPKFLEGFRFLTKLNLSFNDFEGEIPVEGVFNNESALSIIGNTKLCGGIPELNLPRCKSDQSNKKKVLSLKLKLIISFSISSGLLLVSLILYLLLHGRRRSKSETNNNSTFGSPMTISTLKVSYGDLLKATNGFSSTNVIGAGSFGSVYRGVLDMEERTVAIKVLNLESSKACKSFIAECEALRGIRHRNLVKLVTACSSIDYHGNDFKALVYEFMPNGSLDEWLHTELGQEQRHLNIIQRINIAIDVASALDYLHNQCHFSIVHCDLKPSNILLDNEMVACVGDFGLARFLSDPSRVFSSFQSKSVGINGSIGYVAPEYGMGSEVSTYGDVYSYGILLLEMLAGKRPTDDMFKNGLNLHNLFLMALPTRVEQVLDPALLQAEECGTANTKRVQECLISIAGIGVACSAENPRERMEIKNVVTELCLLRDLLLGNKVA